jgi:hypothetical protein
LQELPSADILPKEYRRLAFMHLSIDSFARVTNLHKRRESSIFVLANTHLLGNLLSYPFHPFSAFLMDHEIAQILALALIGGFVLAYKNLKIREKRMESDALHDAQEMDLAERTLSLREKETELEVQKLELEIRLLERKQLDS